MAVSNPKNTKRPARTKATTASEWKKSGSQFPLIETPTGKWIRMKRPGMTRFLEDGFLPDSLAAAIRREISAAKSRPGTAKPSDVKLMKELTADMDGESMLDLLASMDRIVCSVMVEPPVQWHRRPKLSEPDEAGVQHVLLDDKGREITEEIPEDTRRDDVVYTDEIDQLDKNFIFQAAVGGSTDLARFRQEQAAVMDALSAGEGVEEAPERAPAPGV